MKNKYYHQCIGCLVKWGISKIQWKAWPYLQTVCDDCFFEVSEIISKYNKNKPELIKAIHKYQKTKHEG